MPSLIIVHGVGLPTKDALFNATAGIAAAFPNVGSEHRFFVDWNEAAADHVLVEGQFRWASAGRLFVALRSSIRIDWRSQRSASTAIIAGLSEIGLIISRCCFAVIVAAFLLIPTTGLFLTARAAFLLEPDKVSGWSDLADPTALWFLPRQLVTQVLMSGLDLGITAVRIASWSWLSVLITQAVLSLVSAALQNSTSPLRVSIRQMTLGLFGPLLVVFLVPTYDLRPTAGVIAAAFAAPLVFTGALMAFLFVVTLPFFGVNTDLIAAVGSAIFYLVLTSVGLACAIFILAKVRPVFGHVLKIALDILLFIGDRQFRNGTRDELDRVVSEARERCSDGLFYIAAHSLGSAIALSSLLSSKQWLPADQVVLVTLGSPVRRFFQRFYPDYLFPESPHAVAESIASRLSRFSWINVNRPWDPIGSRMGFLPTFEARDRSTGQRRLILRAHVGYFVDPMVAAVLRDEIAGIEPVRRPLHPPTLLPSRPIAQRDALRLPASVTGVLSVAATVAASFFLLHAFWLSASDVDGAFVAQLGKFKSSRVETAIADSRLFAGSEVTGSGRVPVIRTYISFTPAGAAPIDVGPRSVGWFYKRYFFDFDAATSLVERQCQNTPLMWGQTANCPNVPIKVAYQAADPSKFTLPDFALAPVPSLWLRMKKIMSCFIASIAGLLFTFSNLWIVAQALRCVMGIPYPRRS